MYPSCSFAMPIALLAGVGAFSHVGCDSLQAPCLTDVPPGGAFHFTDALRLAERDLRVKRASFRDSGLRASMLTLVFEEEPTSDRPGLNATLMIHYLPNDVQLPLELGAYDLYLGPEDGSPRGYLILSEFGYRNGITVGSARSISNRGAVRITSFAAKERCLQVEGTLNVVARPADLDPDKPQESIVGRFVFDGPLSGE